MRNTLRWLAQHLDWLAHRPEAAEAFKDITRAAWSLRNTIDTSGSLTYIGPCDICHHDLYATEGRPYADCTRCDLRYDVADRRAWLLALWRDQLGTAVEISRALQAWAELDVTPERIRVLAQRQRIEVQRQVVRGRERTVYRFGEVEERAREDAARRAEKTSKRSD